MATKQERQMAYAAGQAVLTEPAERRTVDACPFAEGTEEREQWLAGMADALDDQPDPAELRAALKEARNG